MNHNQSYLEILIFFIVGAAVYAYYISIKKAGASAVSSIQGVWESFHHDGVYLELRCEISQEGSPFFIVDMKRDEDSRVVSFANHQVATLLFQTWKKSWRTQH